MTGYDLVVAARRVVTGGGVEPARVGIRGGLIEAVLPWDAAVRRFGPPQTTHKVRGNGDVPQPDHPEIDASGMAAYSLASG